MSHISVANKYWTRYRAKKSVVAMPFLLKPLVFLDGLYNLSHALVNYFHFAVIVGRTFLIERLP